MTTSGSDSELSLPRAHVGSLVGELDPRSRRAKKKENTSTWKTHSAKLLKLREQGREGSLDWEMATKGRRGGLPWGEKGVLGGVLRNKSGLWVFFAGRMDVVRPLGTLGLG